MTAHVRGALLVAALLAPVAAGCGARESADPVEAPPVARPATRPALVVLVVVDQLPVRLLERTAPVFTGGLARLTGPEAFRATARYHHAATNTCPGHATLSTGADPAVHGVVTNLWFAEGEPVYCAQLELLKAQPLADRVIEAGGRVVSVSHKDRGALLLAGARGLAVWYDRDAGTFAGADWARVDLAPLRSTPWEPAIPSHYALHAADDQPFEASPDGRTTFPHDIGDPRGFLYSAPAGAALVDVALAAVEAEGLGADGTPDLLTVSFSNTDYVGHAYTAESWEAMDALVGVDRALGRLFDALDARIGAGRWAVALTSDHGVAPADATRLHPRTVREAADAALAALGLEGTTRFGEPFLALPPSIPPDRRDEAARAVARAAAAVPGVAGAWAWRQDGIPDGPHAEGVRASLHPEHANDVYLLLDEGTMFGHGDAPTGAGHGTPYPYDAHVPFLLAGAGVRPGAASDLVDVRAVAPTLAALLGVEPPVHAALPPYAPALTPRDAAAASRPGPTR